MSVLHRVLEGPPRRLLVCCILLVAASGAVASAGVRNDVVYFRGQAYTLDRSETEFAVRLKGGPANRDVRLANELPGIGTLHRLTEAGSGCRYRVLEVASADRATRRLAEAAAGVEWVRPVYRLPGADAPILSTGKLVVRLSGDLTEAEAAALFADYGVAVVKPFEGLNNTYILRPEGDPDDDEVLAAAALYADDRVAWAHPDFVLPVRKRQVISDTFFGQQWHLNNTGQEGGIPGADISVTTAWETTQGEDVVVGMLDDSCDVDHEDLLPNYLGIAQDIVDGDDDARPVQVDESHGTAVMGLICAAANSVGVRGVAPAARFTVTRGLFSTAAETASAYIFARQQGVDVHNNSWGYGVGVPAPDVVADTIETVFNDGRDGKGMVILFAAGNEGIRNETDISALPWVIAVGSSNAADQRASHSNFGFHLEVLAPSNNACPDEFCEADPLPNIVTTDVTDAAGYPGAGYNDGTDPFELSDPDYTKTFGGTSAACPIAAGVAALVISVNPELTATQVRVILQHTADQISPDDAGYRGVTTRSDTYGYGRVNATRAVAAASQSAINGGFTWPDRVANVRLTGGDNLSWANGSETQSILIVRSEDLAAFAWVPADGVGFEVGNEVDPGVDVVVSDPEAAESYRFTPPESGVAYFGIFGRNDAGRYSWGVLVDSNGNVTDGGIIDTGGDAGDDGSDVIDVPISPIPKVSVEVSPRRGLSPLTVEFQGNALTDSEITSTEWDFGDDSAVSTERDVSHTYTVTDGRSHRFIATFSVVDEEGDTGQRSIAIDVDPPEGGGSGTDPDTGGGSTGTVEVVATSTGADVGQVDTGFAPLDLEFNLVTSGLPGTFNNVVWDLGDGTLATTLTVFHTYNTPGRYPVQSTVTTCHAVSGCATESNPGGTTWTTTSPIVFIEVLDSGFVVDGGGDGSADAADDVSTGTLPSGGNASSTCGLGLLPLWLGVLGLVSLRRWVR
ncbi:MAG: S8 family serine peptidase [Planctomycetes bacterium]|nr:S8 family serine peptidase [Planctomycetota bacterium]